MTGGLENVRLHGVLMMRGGSGGSAGGLGCLDYERGTELLQIGGSGGGGGGGGGSVHAISRHGVGGGDGRGGGRDKVEDPVCAACQDKIVQRYLLQVNGMHYHTECLRCCVCNVALQGETSCFIRDSRVYCKSDYYRTYGSAQCAKCTRWISSTDWVRRARDSQAEQIYHLACFACDACHRQLSTGEEFALVEKKLLCKTHYQETVDSGDDSCDQDGEDCDGDGGRSTGSGGERSGGSGRGSKSKTKRVRTTFTDEQLQILQANFQIDSNPDGQDLERIAQITGLSKRVTQVWFQNSRARQKKHHHSGGSGVGGGGGGKVAPPGSLNNNSVPGVMLLGTQPATQSSSPTLHHHHVSHHHHGVHHQQQISRVLTRDRDNLSSTPPQQQPVD